MTLSELFAERERALAYGLHNALALIDTEIERLSNDSSAAPVDRKAPARTTAAPSAKKQTA